MLCDPRLALRLLNDSDPLSRPTKTSSMGVFIPKTQIEEPPTVKYLCLLGVNVTVTPGRSCELVK